MYIPGLTAAVEALWRRPWKAMSASLPHSEMGLVYENRITFASTGSAQSSKENRSSALPTAAIVCRHPSDDDVMGLRSRQRRVMSCINEEMKARERHHRANITRLRVAGDRFKGTAQNLWWLLLKHVKRAIKRSYDPDIAKTRHMCSASWLEGMELNTRGTKSFRDMSVNGWFIFLLS